MIASGFTRGGPGAASTLPLTLPLRSSFDSEIVAEILPTRCGGELHGATAKRSPPRPAARGTTPPK